MTTILLLALLAQGEKPSPQDVLEKHRDRLLRMDGVVGLSLGGSKTSPVLTIQARSAETGAAIKKALGADLEGLKIFVYASQAPPPAEENAKPAEQPQAPPPEQPPAQVPPPAQAQAQAQAPGAADWSPWMEKCDIIRDRRKLKPTTHHDDGKTITGCQIIRRQVFAGGGGHSFWFTKHRTACPIRRGQVHPSAAQEGFESWVLTRGFGPATRGAFLWPFELKASDSLWMSQAREDLASVLPWIRDGAVWSGQSSADGFGWSWTAPKPPSVPPAVATPSK